ncbi:MAG: alpha-1,4-glucan--maltose-1-phosphate maltosyltransferase [Elusimicrobiota bacterium]
MPKKGAKDKKVSTVPIQPAARTADAPAGEGKWIPVNGSKNEKIRARVQIEGVQPKFSGGRFPVKRIIGDTLKVEADIFIDGHNELSAALFYRKEGQSKWSETPMTFSDNDRWLGEFKVTAIGRWNYTIQAWVDNFKTWKRDFKKRVSAGQDVAIDLLIGLEMVNKVFERTLPKDKDTLNRIIAKLTDKKNKTEAAKAALSDELSVLMAKYPDKTNAAEYKELGVVVDPKIARFSSWYELFPRSWSAKQGKHGTFKDVIARLPYIAEMGFNVLYLPPIHPIGAQFRKGKNNSVKCGNDDVGSPWAIGSAQGGHKSIHPELGTFEDFHELIAQAGKLGISVSIDIAYQCSPDHPYVKEHPEWFRKRPDNTIQYAENPPKKYHDIYPLNFETENWQELWEELKSVITFWIGHGIRIFRMDNPHTKDLSFWEWMITGIKKDYPDVIFLAEAFTRPKLMYRLAKLGFSQSYTYFTWRNTKQELTQYLTELTKTEVSEFYRPNLWPNTPDILHEYLQRGGASAFKIRFMLAATLTSNYGIYGPAFELCVNKPFAAGSEEYLNSEKYEIKKWDVTSPGSIRPLIAKVNQLRNKHSVFQHDQNLEFVPVDNEHMICYAKYSADYSEVLLIIVNLDTFWAQSGWIELPLKEFGLPENTPFEVNDLLDGKSYLWNGPRNFIRLDPSESPAHILKLR